MTEKLDLAILLGKPAGGIQTREQIKSWFHVGREPHLKEGEVQELLHLLHPKGVFFKTLPGSSCLLDVGAGDGSLNILSGWPFPPRGDIKLYAFGLLKGQHYDNLDGYELGHWPETTPRFPGVEFNAIFCSHFIEHIESRHAVWLRFSADPQVCRCWAVGVGNESLSRRTVTVRKPGSRTAARHQNPLFAWFVATGPSPAHT